MKVAASVFSVYIQHGREEIHYAHRNRDMLTQIICQSWIFTSRCHCCATVDATADATADATFDATADAENHRQR